MVMRLLLIVSCLTIGLESLNAQVRLGPIFGANYANQVWKSNTYLMQGSSKTRLFYHFGATSDIQVTPRFSVQPEITFSVKGTDFTTEYPNNVHRTKRNIGYFHMPICLTVNKEYDHSFIFAGIGPYISRIGITNSTFYQNDVNVQNGSLNIGYTTADDINPLDAGIKTKAGFIIKPGFTFTVFYEYGFKDINPQQVQVYNRTLGASLSYLFSVSEEDRYQRYGDYYNF